jgi:hypothetical protein
LDSNGNKDWVEAEIDIASMVIRCVQALYHLAQWAAKACRTKLWLVSPKATDAVVAMSLARDQHCWYFVGDESTTMQFTRQSPPFQLFNFLPDCHRVR